MENANTGTGSSKFPSTFKHIFLSAAKAQYSQINNDGSQSVSSVQVLSVQAKLIVVVDSFPNTNSQAINGPSLPLLTTDAIPSKPFGP
jgi:hypothetical protein